MSAPFFIPLGNLLMLLIEPNVQSQTNNHHTERTELNGVDIIPTQEMAKNQYYCGNDNEDDAQILQKSFHNVILFLVYSI